jgi:signal transduction histidine kinase
MPPINTWLLITLQAPLWAAILIALAFILVIVFFVVSFYRLSTRHKELQVELNDARNDRVNASLSVTRATPEGSAYLQFLYNISHEVSNPLQSIQTNLDNMARCTPEETSRWQQYLEIINAEIHRLITLTENLRLLSRLETPEIPVKREPVNIKGVIEAVMMSQAEVAETKGVRIIYNGPERPARALGDRDHLIQVLNNLVDNAIKFSHPEGGEVIIGVQQQNESLLVRVIDDGIGISAQDLPYVFDTAYQAPMTGGFRRAGSGLGLAITKRIVEQHGGKIQIQSQPNHGTTVSFDLPIYIPS